MCFRVEGEVLLLLCELVLSWVLVCKSADLGRLLVLFEGKVGELCAERYIEGSEKLAIAFDVLSRANAANVDSAPRFCFVELVESVD